MSGIRRADVVVGGGGPAGVLSSVLLSRQGYNVALLCSARSTPRIEGLGERVVDIFTAHDLRYAARAVGPRVRRLAHWGNDHGERNAEFVTRRDLLDVALLQDAEANGVGITMVRRYRVKTRNGGVSVRLADDADDPLEAQFYIEARGRAAPRASGGRYGPKTIALLREIVPPGPAGTVVESFADGWAWYVSTGEQAILQVFIDSSVGLPKRKVIGDLFNRLHAQLALILRFTDEASATGPVTTRNATALLSGQLVSAHGLRTGDAAAAIDPLSGHGVFEALGSALAATATVNTVLRAPERSELAGRFFSERAQLGFERNARIGRDFYRLDDRWADRPFWATRQSWPDDEPAHGAPGSVPAMVKRLPVVADGLVCEDRVVVTADHPRGVWRVDDVALAPLLDMLQQSGGQPNIQMVEQYARHFAVRPSQITNAINWLKAAQVVP